MRSEDFVGPWRCFMKPRKDSAFIGPESARAERNRKPERRSIPLTDAQQEHILHDAIPWRIQIIRKCIGPEGNAFQNRTAAVLLSRAIAGFLGIRLGKNGLGLARDHEYYVHNDGCSWEVKIVDILGEDSFVDLDKLTSWDRRALEQGLAEANLAFAHITYWSDSGNQTSDGGPTADYQTEQRDKIKAFAEVVIRLFEEKAEAAKAARQCKP